MTRIIQTFTDFGNREWKDRLEGGEADDKTPDYFEEDDLKIGTKVEREHSSNPDIATEIAMDHLSEDPEYYDKLIAAGIADEEEAIDLYDEIKNDNDKEKARKDIMGYIEEEDDDDVEYDGIEVDDLGTDRIDFEDDELIFDEEEPKNKRVAMENNSLKKYNSFIKESAPVEEEIVPEYDGATADPGPERKYTKENKYKFQLSYEKKIADKLKDYNFTYYVPDEEKEVTIPTRSTHFIIIDILNLNYAIVGSENPDIKPIDPSKLKNLLENL